MKTEPDSDDQIMKTEPDSDDQDMNTDQYPEDQVMKTEPDPYGLIWGGREPPLGASAQQEESADCSELQVF